MLNLIFLPDYSFQVQLDEEIKEYSVNGCLYENYLKYTLFFLDLINF
jgi:hypothetical protein